MVSRTAQVVVVVASVVRRRLLPRLLPRLHRVDLVLELVEVVLAWAHRAAEVEAVAHRVAVAEVVLAEAEVVALAEAEVVDLLAVDLRSAAPLVVARPLVVHRLLVDLRLVVHPPCRRPSLRRILMTCHSLPGTMRRRRVARRKRS